MSSWREIFDYLIPPPEDRITLAWGNAHRAFAYMAPVCLMSYLVRRRDTKVLRVALLPVILVMAVRGTFAYANETRPETILLNWMRGLACFAAIGLSIDCALSRTSRMKLGETPESLPPMFFLDKDYPQYARRRWPAWLADVTEMQLTFRGIGWNFGEGIYISPERRNLSRGPFLSSTFVTYIKGYLVIDGVQAFFRHAPGLGAPHGASIWDPSLPFVQRYAFGSFLHILIGIVIWFGLEMNYSLATLIGVGLFGQPPSAWPPVYGNPWKADSVHNFWAKQWHQILRRVFMVLGGIPGQWVAGRVGAVMGTFIASGLFHECGFYLVNRGMDHRVTVFFALQGIAILAEKIYFQWSGRRVGGWIGRLWTYMWILVIGQICTDAWLSRGLGHTVFIPTPISPAEHIIIPLGKKLLCS
ncbi:hypothetical protein EIP91_000750 [Steccherinum ochraceum]|uniref:Wax synthase domain-containing protein n=1 Tax=Steccherinum ochraceum TaxID=92696 RepID=A0A4R0RFD4_9APHY|nr:hypothetical protein EIP91_000750 [Steccherinum ochraceum]